MDDNLIWDEEQHRYVFLQVPYPERDLNAERLQSLMDESSP